MNAPDPHEEAAALDMTLAVAGDTMYAFPTSVIVKVTEPQVVTPLPFVPRFVEGLVNVNGSVLPQLDLALCLGHDAAAAGGELLLLDTGSLPCALRVQRVVAKVEIAPEEFRGGAPQEADDAAFVAGTFTWQGRSVLVLDCARFGALVAPTALPSGQAGMLGHAQEQAGDQHEYARCLVVETAGERYAFLLEHVLEILRLPSLAAVPGAAAAVLGLALIRQHALLVLSLATLLGRPRDDTANFAVVVERDGAQYGLAVRDVCGILDFPADRLHDLDEANGALSGIMIGGDDSIVGRIEPRRLIGEALHDELRAWLPAARRQDAQREETQLALLQLAIGSEHCAVPLEHVHRIVSYREPEPLHGVTDSLLAGAVDINGAVLPAVDLAGELGQADAARGALVIVGDGGGREWALLVSEVICIGKVAASRIEDVAGGSGRLVGSIANVDGRLISILDLAPLFALQAVEALDA